MIVALFTVVTNSLVAPKMFKNRGSGFTLILFYRGYTFLLFSIFLSVRIQVINCPSFSQQRHKARPTASNKILLRVSS